MTYKKGTSGNPGGKVSPKELRELCRTLTDEAVMTLREIMNDRGENAQTRIDAAVSILDRGWGKPSQQIELLRQEIQVIASLTDDEILELAPHAAKLLVGG